MADDSPETPLQTMLSLPAFLPYRLSVLSNRISRTIAKLYADRFALTIPEWRVMAILGETSDVSAGEVAERTAMDKVAVSRAVARLLAAGRIERHLDPTDRRRSVLALSKAGRAIYDAVAPLALAYERRLLDSLDEDDRAALDRLLAKLEKRNFDALAD